MGKHEVLRLPPEFLLPQDGIDKQDSELAAAKRWLGLSLNAENLIMFLQNSINDTLPGGRISTRNCLHPCRVVHRL